MAAELRVIDGGARPSGATSIDPEAVYDELLEHVHGGGCRRCWTWRNAVWTSGRLCSVGAGLVDAYAAAVTGLPVKSEIVKSEIGDGDAEVSGQAFGGAPWRPVVVQLPTAERGRIDSDAARNFDGAEGVRVAVLELGPDGPDAVRHGPAGGYAR